VNKLPRQSGIDGTCSYSFFAKLVNRVAISALSVNDNNVDAITANNSFFGESPLQEGHKLSDIPGYQSLN